MQHSDPVREIVIVGAGLAGLIQARALAAKGFSPHVVDPRSATALRQSNADTRATALTPRSIELLGLPDAWLQTHGQRISEMVVDGGLTTGTGSGQGLASGQWSLGGFQP